ncbi:hypothetical protein HMPREF1008_00445 [Olsenella sp. oral taxon 809 str. F0356]|uniref:hypothetical protein n=1 Tax=Olsenella sp. oral taxon 809 TaxID=661086 RepID=UPI000231EC6D|nr:hypothetical protein [Olsenella sp. oral taxon 809]EHF02800.1 hypothetical protein HMPREF1008_00445 [Olsenella sp. oral taxon 809 str. F0356]
MKVVSLDELARQPIVRILKHDDRYHAYTEDGSEFICREDPSRAFPKIKIGTFEGSHDGHVSHVGRGARGGAAGNGAPRSRGKAGASKPAGPIAPIKQDKNDPKRVLSIEHHNNHWHLHHADGFESVVYEDPSSAYPDIKITEYDPNMGRHFEPLKPGESFRYEDVDAALLVPLDQINYGNVVHSVDYDEAAGGFVIPHHDHYHYVSIQTIIQFCKDGGDTFHGNDPRAVVATLKYLVQHPEARPKGKNGWGSDAEVGHSGGGHAHDDERNGDHEVERGHEHAAESRDEEEADFTRGPRIERIVHEGSVWYVYYVDGSFSTLTHDPEDRYPGVPIEEGSTPVNDGMSDDEITSRYCALYGMSGEEFQDTLFELPNVPLQNIKFLDDGTAIIHGVRYDFKNLLAKIVREQEEARRKSEEGHARADETTAHDASAEGSGQEDARTAAEGDDRAGTPATDKDEVGGEGVATVRPETEPTREGTSAAVGHECEASAATEGADPERVDASREKDAPAEAADADETPAGTTDDAPGVA